MRTKNQQTGSGIVEFTIVAIPIILLGLGGVELTAWLSLRQTLSLALIQAGRVASSQHAQPEIIAEAFENSLNMAYPSQEKLINLLNQSKQELGLPWQIKILSPSKLSFLDHKSNIQSHTNKPFNNKQLFINNYYQDLQHENNINKGWPNGQGQNSDTDIFDANTLKLELIWPHKPILPGLRQIISLLKPFFNHNKSIVAAGYLPFKRNISLSMQSHPGLWDDLKDGRVIYAASDLNHSCNIDSFKCYYSPNKASDDVSNSQNNSGADKPSNGDNFGSDKNITSNNSYDPNNQTNADRNLNDAANSDYQEDSFNEADPVDANCDLSY